MASFLKTESHHQCDILDVQLDHLEYSEVEEQIRKNNPDVVGITCFTVQLVDVKRCISCTSCRCQICCFGWASYQRFSKRVFGTGRCRCCRQGEGQQPLLSLLDVWERGEVAKGIEGVIAHEDDPIPVDDVYFSNDLDAYPIIDRTLVDYTRYYDVMGKGVFLQPL